ncbi:MAG: hypothetical protein Q8N44_18150 [Rubrivivax sp.]|nr:hypothetical protein [Rubrivivax sp.]
MAALLPVLALSAYELFQPVAIINGEADDAPQRAIGVPLVALPIIYVVLALFAYGAGAVMLRIGIHTMGKFLLASASLAALLSVPFSFRSAEFGTPDQLISVLVFGSLFAVSAVPAAACWLLLAKGRG